MARAPLPLAVLVTAVLAGCGNDPTGPRPEACDVGNLDLTVATGSTVTLDWNPSCPVALVLLERDDGSDVWLVQSTAWDDSAETPSVSWNTIAPPIKYGIVPSGADARNPAEPLMSGQEYTLNVYRVLESGLAINWERFTYN